MLKFDNKVFNKNSDLWVAFSGGKDSLTMTHRLMKASFNIKGLLHFNHGFPDSDKIERGAWLAGFHALGLPMTIGKVKTPYKASSGESKEAWARDRRYEWLEKFSGDVVVCHHLGDATENYLMNCFRGHPEYFPIHSVTDRGSIRVIRPFIRCKSREVGVYLKQNMLDRSVVEDPMNNDFSVLRVKTRKMLEYIPGLEKVVFKKFYL